MSEVQKSDTRTGSIQNEKRESEGAARNRSREPGPQTGRSHATGHEPALKANARAVGSADHVVEPADDQPTADAVIDDACVVQPLDRLAFAMA